MESEDSRLRRKVVAEALALGRREEPALEWVGGLHRERPPLSCRGLWGRGWVKRYDLHVAVLGGGCGVGSKGIGMYHDRRSTSMNGHGRTWNYYHLPIYITKEKEKEKEKEGRRRITITCNKLPTYLPT